MTHNIFIDVLIAQYKIEKAQGIFDKEFDQKVFTRNNKLFLDLHDLSYGAGLCSLIKFLKDNSPSKESFILITGKGIHGNREYLDFNNAMKTHITSHFENELSIKTDPKNKGILICTPKEKH